MSKTRELTAFSLRKSAVATAIGLLASQSVSAANITVNMGCSLQDAIRSANTNTSVGGCTAGESAARDTVMLPSTTIFTYSVATQTAPSGGDDVPFSALPTITSDITIQGAGSTIARDPIALPFRLFYVSGYYGGDLALESLTLQNGYASGPSGIFKAGGAIRSNSGNLSLDNVTVTGNSAERRGGGINVSGAAQVTITNSIISSNSAGLSNINGGGGGISVGGGNHSLTVTGSTITLNQAQYGCGVETYFGTTASFSSSFITDNCSTSSINNTGGGITASDTSVSITSTQVTGNSVATDRGAGIQVFDIVEANVPPLKLEIQSSNISNNLGGPGVTASGVNLYVISSTVSGNETSGIDGGSSVGYLHSSTLSMNGGTGIIFNAGGAGAFSLIESTISGNAKGIDIYSSSAELSSVNISNSTLDGGGNVAANDSLTLSSVDITGNSAEGSVGGLSAIGNIILANNVSVTANSTTSTNSPGGMRLGHTGVTPVTATGLTVMNNMTYGGGGGLILSAAEYSSLTLSSSTISGNSAQRSGGGVRVEGRGTSVLDSVNIYANYVDGPVGSQAGAGVYMYRAGSLSILNSQIFQNTAYGCGGLCSQGNSNFPGMLSVQGSSIRDNFGSNYGSNGGGIGIGYFVTALLDSSTISGNEAAIGGGISINGGSLVGTNLTISANTAKDQGGGGVSKSGFGDARLTNATVFGNIQSGGFGVGGVHGAVELNSSVIAGSIGGDCYQSAVPGNQPIIGDDNWFEDATCTGVANGPPLLGPLADNGGTTLTHALQLGSPLIDAGGQCGLPVDQLGTIRSECKCDVGAFEVLELEPDNSSCKSSFFVIPVIKNGNIVIIDL